MGSIQSQIEGSLDPLGLSWAKFNALSQLANSDMPLLFGELADKCACVRSNITQLMDRLESEGLVVRTPDLHDRRSTRAELTKKGLGLYKEGAAALSKVEHALTAHLGKRERSDLLSTLESLPRRD